MKMQQLPMQKCLIDFGSDKKPGPKTISPKRPIAIDFAEHANAKSAVRLTKIDGSESLASHTSDCYPGIGHILAFIQPPEQHRMTPNMCSNINIGPNGQFALVVHAERAHMCVCVCSNHDLIKPVSSVRICQMPCMELFAFCHSLSFAVVRRRRCCKRVPSTARTYATRVLGAPGFEQFESFVCIFDAIVTCRSEGRLAGTGRASDDESGRAAR